MTLSKAEIARRQLGTALALFLKDADPVSVHCLACGGGEVAEHLTRKAGVESFTTHTLATFPDMDERELRRLRNQYWNAFKHATTREGLDRDDKALLDRFCDEDNEAALIVGWHDYQLATGKLPVEAQAFQAWYFSLHPEKLGPEVDTFPYEALFPGIRNMSHARRKVALRKVIAAARRDDEVMNDPRTDTRPLVLGA